MRGVVQKLVEVCDGVVFVVARGVVIGVRLIGGMLVLRWRPRMVENIGRVGGTASAKAALDRDANIKMCEVRAELCDEGAQRIWGEVCVEGELCLSNVDAGGGELVEQGEEMVVGKARGGGDCEAAEGTACEQGSPLAIGEAAGERRVEGDGGEVREQGAAEGGRHEGEAEGGEGRRWGSLVVAAG